MKKIFGIAVIILILCSFQADNTAKLKMINKSQRYLTVKIIKGIGKKSELYTQATIPPKDQYIFNFIETGKYYVKSMAILNPGNGNSNDTLFTKGKPFMIIADPRKGYSMMKMKFNIKESKRSLATGAIPISKKEFLSN